jgi:hypothetical protein
MAKDPAINWYFDNWNGGTTGFTRHQKGCYMDLLQSQFYLDHLSLDQIKNILGPDFSQWSVLKAKFLQDEQGNFFNERMDTEKKKRAKYSESRANNRKKKDMNNISNRYDLHMSNTPGIGIGTETKKEKGVEEKLKRLDDIYLEQQKMKWGHIDFDFEYRAFCEKVRGSPEVYQDHQDLRLAFQAQLRNAKPKQNVKSSSITKDQRDQYLRQKYGVEGVTNGG